MLRNDHRRKPQGLADLLLPFALIEDGILLQYDGSLMAGWAYRGPDTISAAPAEMDALSHRLNSALRLGGGWIIRRFADPEKAARDAKAPRRRSQPV